MTRRLIGGLSVVPQLEDMLGMRTALHGPALLKHTRLIENPACQNLSASFKEIETTQELIDQQQHLHAMLQHVAENMGMPIDAIRETLGHVAREQGEAKASRLFLHMCTMRPESGEPAPAGGPPDQLGAPGGERVRGRERGKPPALGPDPWWSLWWSWRWSWRCTPSSRGLHGRTTASAT